MAELLTTPLNSLHIELGAKMVPFAGYSMPVQYAGGIVKEHLQTREHAGVFDVSHMGQLLLSGQGIDSALEKILPINVKGLKAGHQRYCFFTLENGGILDDLILTRIDENSFYMVVNASRKDVMRFMNSKVFNVDGINYRVSRLGYTGEDGYEISMPAGRSISFTKKLLAQDNVKPAGLGARDSLRLEAGLCLYGNDIDENTTPVEADLLWAIQKARKAGGEREGGFIGADVILPQIASGASRQRVGFIVDGKVPVRAHSELFDAGGNKIGEVTSGGFGATLNAPVAVGYVDTAHSDIGTKVIAKVRKKAIALTVAKLPLVPQRYYRG